jgi:membrane protein implicated in regulation of membrane protease activity
MALGLIMPGVKCAGGYCTINYSMTESILFFIFYLSSIALIIYYGLIETGTGEAISLGLGITISVLTLVALGYLFWHHGSKSPPVRPPGSQVEEETNRIKSIKMSSLEFYLLLIGFVLAYIGVFATCVVQYWNSGEWVTGIASCAITIFSVLLFYTFYHVSSKHGTETRKFFRDRFTFVSKGRARRDQEDAYRRAYYQGLAAGKQQGRRGPLPPPSQEEIYYDPTNEPLYATSSPAPGAGVDPFGPPAQYYQEEARQRALAQESVEGQLRELQEDVALTNERVSNIASGQNSQFSQYSAERRPPRFRSEIGSEYTQLPEEPRSR